MKRFIILLFLVSLLPSMAMAGESYPTFDRDYWVKQQDLAQGKIHRGAGLGILGLVSIWPTSLMIAKATKDPPKYLALSGLFVAGTLGALFHGFGSVGFGKDQKDTATSYVKQYDVNTGVVDVAAQQKTYLDDKRKSTKKVRLFGVYLSGLGTMLLTNGVVQSVRKHQGKDVSDIHIWPYYVAGGLLMAGGVAIFIRAHKRLSDLTDLENSTPSPVTGGVTPLLGLSPNGDAVLGVSFGSSF